MDYMYELKDMLCEELEHIAEKGELTAGSLETIDKLTHSIKSLATIIAMDESEYSYDDMGGTSNRYYRGNSYARRGRYSRANRGGYSRRRYSRDDEMDKMVEKLEKMMEQTDDQNAKNAIQQAIEMMG